MITINTENKYIMTTADRQYYQYMTEEEKANCKTYDSGSIICYQPNYLINAGIETCEWNILTRGTFEKCITREIQKQTTIIPLKQRNTWFFAIPYENYHITNICNEIIKDQNTLDGEGIITIHENCTIINNQIKLIARTTLKSNTAYTIPTILFGNLNELRKIDNFENLSRTNTNNTINIASINRTIQEFKEKQVLQDHDKKINFNFPIIYLCIAILIIFKIKTKFQNKRKPIQQCKASKTTTSISMPELSI